jgi:Tol biopolymer transport system component
VTAVHASLAEALHYRYQFERELGHGGMATVYLAHDLRHHRKVAIKVLRPELAATVGAERFLQEIETAAQFQHPHILPLLDSGEAGGFLYYVMPYAEGESLRARLAGRGELPVPEAVRILIEICDALAYAHERGIVHRDIKPDNVLLSGRHALVTDFGVAKALSEATGRQQLTTAGVALGTPAYMAPEQATADPYIDHRADIYALGVLGYELISGKPPFVGRSAQETLAAHVIQRPEPLAAICPACPPGLEAVIMKCLEKRPIDRWQTADELLVQLELLATPSGGTTPTTTRPLGGGVPPPPQPGRRWRKWLVATAAILLVIAAAVALALSRSAPEIRLGRRVQLTLTPGLEIDPALSPDGALVAFVTGPPSQTRLYVRQVDGGTPVAITPEGSADRLPRFSPDGKRLVFRSRRGLELIPALGGASRLLLPAEPGVWVEAAWSPDGKSLVYTKGDSVFTRPVGGGEAHGIAQLTEAHSCTWSPDARWIACVSGNRTFMTRETFGNIAASSIWIISAVGGPAIRVSDDQSLNTSPTWLASDGSLLYVSNYEGGRDIYQVRLKRDGRPARPASRVTTGLSAAQVNVSADGRRLVYAAFTENANVWSLPIPTAGTPATSVAEPVTSGTQMIEAFDISLDGKWLVFDSDRSGTQQIYRVPLAGGEPEQLTTGAEPAFQPGFSPDGQEVAYHSFRDGRRQIFVISADGGTPTQVTDGRENSHGAKWSPDGRTLSFIVGEINAASQEVRTVSRNAEGHWGRVRLLRKGIGAARWSRDGRAILMAPSGEGPSGEYAVRATADGQERQLVDQRDSAMVALGNGAWSEDGRLVYFLARDPKRQDVSLWNVSTAGRRPRLIAPLPREPSRTTDYRVHDGRFYFTAGDQQSDIWMTEVLGSR